MRPNVPASLQYTSYTPPEDVISVDAAAIAEYDALPIEERVKAARLVAHTGCSIAMAVAAVKALRPEVKP